MDASIDFPTRIYYRHVTHECDDPTCTVAHELICNMPSELPHRAMRLQFDANGKFLRMPVYQGDFTVLLLMQPVMYAISVQLSELDMKGCIALMHGLGVYDEQEKPKPIAREVNPHPGLKN